ncbi:MAG: cob(I)yrinic acid a,c-diamide adenosyltransferase [Crenarchaeota archaeon]|nr:MAG: cob(I)yrinic acid a,c-diamide adenosyltransferase [Thermoproteota archaeon]RDJ34163.1 MAG: cob(I)yrinic acid a,c-diamide adenosyltransferase [Thermoproteota archaeon]RDJ36722.1 MAG: cob(I)yrinic acid a,c-diamide adenosyltransferase [Thermoproteota archaeon]RDJ37745.1 MAG: cob(I)yrinic acid a,c-diamide adenosyltransferase [Thermoproteota archaeon]
MKIYTKTGDDGTTGLQSGPRVSKTDSRIKAYGIVDEINSILGIALTFELKEDIKKILTRIQNELFVLGSDLSNPDLEHKENRIEVKMIENLEQDIDKLEENLPPLTNFILPGGNQAASQIHFARTVTRRAEIQTVELSENQKINKLCITYLNRLSDLLFVIGRTINKQNNVSDVIWSSGKDTL